jgi:hypothetical protein
MSGEMAGPTVKRNPPKCYMTICDATGDNCSREASIVSGQWNTVNKVFKTEKKQTTVDVQISVYCPNAKAGAASSVYLDGVTFALD